MVTLASGGGAGSPFQTIVGSSLYVVPSGFWASVLALEGASELFINATKIFSSNGAFSSTPFSFTGSVPSPVPSDGANGVLHTATSTHNNVFSFSSVGTLDLSYSFTSLVSVVGVLGIFTFSLPPVPQPILTIKKNGVILHTATADITETFSITGNVGDIVDISATSYTHNYKSGAYSGYVRHIANYSGANIFNSPTSKPSSGNISLKEGDTIQGGTYALNLFEV